MKRIISILALSAFVGISGLSAGVDSSESKATQTLSKADSEFLFGANAKNLNVEILSQKELEETQGEFWTAIGVGLGISAVSYGLCAIFSKGCRFNLNFGSRF